MNSIIPGALSVNPTPAPQFYPVAPTQPERRYEHSYVPPSEQFHLVANDEGPILKPAVGRTAYAILECLRSHLNSKTGQCNPSLALIAAEIGAQPSTVTANLKYLYEANVVTLASREIVHQRRGRTTRERVNNQYILNACEAWTPERVTRKRAQKPSENRSTLVENLPTGCRESERGVGAKSSTNKKKQNETKSKSRTQHRALEKAPSQPPAVVVDLEFQSAQEDSCEKFAARCDHIENAQPKAPSAPAPSSESHSHHIDALLARLTALHVAPDVARGLLSTTTAAAIQLQLDCLADRAPRDPAATLVKSIRENWSAPAKYLERMAAQERAEKSHHAQEAAREKAAQHRAQKRQSEAEAAEEVARLDAQWVALPQSERDRINAEVVARLGVVARRPNSEGARESMRRVVLSEREGADHGPTVGANCP